MGCVCGAHERNSSLQELLQSTAATELRSNLSRTKSRTISISESILNGLTPRYSERNGYSNRGGVSKEFLDNHQYTKEGILTYEKVFGHNFVSPGGITTTTQFVAKYLHLEQGQKVLDVGCGIGGSAFHMAFKYGVNVLGIDLSSNMIEIANERLVKERMRFPAGASVGFELCDATKRNFPENSFDVIYSRDTILHIRDKQRLFESFLKWLKPDGILFITDYCCGDPPHSAEFHQYLEDWKYHLLTPDDYTTLIENAGFVDVDGQDATNRFIEISQAELDLFESEFPDDAHVIEGWESKISRCESGDQKWGIFCASKPHQAVSPKQKL